MSQIKIINNKKPLELLFNTIRESYSGYSEKLKESLNSIDTKLFNDDESEDESHSILSQITPWFIENKIPLLKAQIMPWYTQLTETNPYHDNRDVTLDFDSEFVFKSARRDLFEKLKTLIPEGWIQDKPLLGECIKQNFNLAFNKYPTSESVNRANLLKRISKEIQRKEHNDEERNRLEEAFKVLVALQALYESDPTKGSNPIVKKRANWVAYLYLAYKYGKPDSLPEGLAQDEPTIRDYMFGVFIEFLYAVMRSNVDDPNPFHPENSPACVDGFKDHFSNMAGTCFEYLKFRADISVFNEPSKEFKKAILYQIVEKLEKESLNEIEDFLKLMIKFSYGDVIDQDQSKLGKLFQFDKEIITKMANSLAEEFLTSCTKDLSAENKESVFKDYKGVVTSEMLNLFEKTLYSFQTKPKLELNADDCNWLQNAAFSKLLKNSSSIEQDIALLMEFNNYIFINRYVNEKSIEDACKLLKLLSERSNIYPFYLNFLEIVLLSIQNNFTKKKVFIELLDDAQKAILKKILISQTTQEEKDFNRTLFNHFSWEDFKLLFDWTNISSHEILNPNNSFFIYFINSKLAQKKYEHLAQFLNFLDQQALPEEQLKDCITCIKEIIKKSLKEDHKKSASAFLNVFLNQPEFKKYHDVIPEIVQEYQKELNADDNKKFTYATMLLNLVSLGKINEVGLNDFDEKILWDLLFTENSLGETDNNKKDAQYFKQALFNLPTNKFSDLITYLNAWDIVFADPILYKPLIKKIIFAANETEFRTFFNKDFPNKEFIINLVNETLIETLLADLNEGKTVNLQRLLKQPPIKLFDKEILILDFLKHLPHSIFLKLFKNDNIKNELAFILIKTSDPTFKYIFDNINSQNYSPISSIFDSIISTITHSIPNDDNKKVITSFLEKLDHTGIYNVLHKCASNGLSDFYFQYLNNNQILPKIFSITFYSSNKSNFLSLINTFIQALEDGTDVQKDVSKFLTQLDPEVLLSIWDSYIDSFTPFIKRNSNEFKAIQVAIANNYTPENKNYLEFFLNIAEQKNSGKEAFDLLKFYFRGSKLIPECQAAYLNFTQSPLFIHAITYGFTHGLLDPLIFNVLDNLPEKKISDFIPSIAEHILSEALKGRTEHLNKLFNLIGNPNLKEAMQTHLDSLYVSFKGRLEQIPSKEIMKLYGVMIQNEEGINKLDNMIRCFPEEKLIAFFNEFNLDTMNAETAFDFFNRWTTRGFGIPRIKLSLPVLKEMVNASADMLNKLIIKYTEVRAPILWNDYPKPIKVWNPVFKEIKDYLNRKDLKEEDLYNLYDLIAYVHQHTKPDPFDRKEQITNRIYGKENFTLEKNLTLRKIKNHAIFIGLLLLGIILLATAITLAASLIFSGPASFFILGIFSTIAHTVIPTIGAAVTAGTITSGVTLAASVTAGAAGLLGTASFAGGVFFKSQCNHDTFQEKMKKVTISFK